MDFRQPSAALVALRLELGRRGRDPWAHVLATAAEELGAAVPPVPQQGTDEPVAKWLMRALKALDSRQRAALRNLIRELAGQSPLPMHDGTDPDLAGCCYCSGCARASYE